MSLEYQKLGDVADFIRGITYKPNDLVENFSEGSTVCMRTANVQVQLKQDDLLSVPVNLVKNEDKFLIEGDILVSTANSWNLVGKCCWIPKLEYSATAGGFISILRANQEKLDQRYLYHWFNSPNTQLLARNCGRQTTNISNMDLERCLSIKIPLPPLAEQRRIASILDQADELRQKRQQAIEKLDQLLQSTFYDYFGDPIQNTKNFPLKDFKSIIKFTGGSQPPKSVFSDTCKEGYVRLVQIRDFRTDKYLTFIPKDSARRFFKRTDVMIGRYGPPVFQILRGLEGAYNVALMKAEPKAELDNDFLFYLLAVASIQQLVIANSQRSAGQTGVNLEFLNNLVIGVPPLEIQKAWAKIALKIEDQKKKLNEQLDMQNQLFSSLQNQAFNGTL